MDMHKENSWAVTKGREMGTLDTIEKRERMIRSYASTWNIQNQLISIAYDKHDPKLRLLVKYEELKQNTYEILKNIYDFLDIIIIEQELQKIIDKYSFEKIPDSEKGSGKFYRAAATKDWKKNFSNNEQDIMNSIMTKTLEKFGYSL